MRRAASAANTHSSSPGKGRGRRQRRRSGSRSSSTKSFPPEAKRSPTTTTSPIGTAPDDHRNGAGHIRRPARAGQQRRHPARQDVRQHGLDMWDAVIRVHLRRHLRANEACRRLLARTTQSGDPVSHPRVVNTCHRPVFTATPAIQLRCRQSGHSGLHRHSRRRTGAAGTTVNAIAPVPSPR